MAFVHVSDLCKTYRIAKRDSGAWGAVRGVFKREYKDIQALRNLSFDIERGELVGYIGPNGAGKSTTIKILSGILVPTSGACIVDDLVPWESRRSHVSRIGVVFGQRTQLWWDLPVVESFQLLKEIYRVSETTYRDSLDELVELLSLQSLLDTPVRQLSLGQRMRCDLAASLLHKPSILFLDEPTIGLDAVSKLAVRDFIRELNERRNVTVILTTHDMDDIEALCRRIMLINNGQLLFDGKLDGLRKQVSSERHLRLTLTHSEEIFADPDLRVVRQDDGQVILAFDPTHVPTAEMIARVTSEHAVSDLYVENPPIEEIIARFYEGEGQ